MHSRIDHMKVEEGPALDYGDYSLEVQDTDFEVDAGAANANQRDRTASDNPLSQWMEDQDIYLQELLQNKGHEDYIHNTVCRNCGSGAPRFCCRDCFGTELCCHNCVVTLHAKHPTHRIQEWIGLYFVTISLKKLGLRMQLGHPVGEHCLLPQRAFNDDFTLIDTNGIHEIGLDFCGCEVAERHTKQLLRTAWFPATSTDPRSAATFRILEQYHLLSFKSKASGYEFYHSLARLTDNTGLQPRKDHYEAFLRIIQEWQHLKMLKRVGRGYDPSSVKNTKSGECAVLCPACPQPGRNLPDNWEEAPKEIHWLYGLFLAIDANFRLKRRMVSKDSVDPGLSHGWAYFVEETTYKKFIQSHGGTLQQKSTCSSHNAVNMADMKVSQGLAATGVGTINCERYTNMDFLFFSTLHGRGIDTLNISYNIACQWHKNLWERMSAMPSELHLDHAMKSVRFFMPKFHLPAHILKCQTMFSFNFSKNVGCTDGEAPERGWSNINPVASSMKEMGPGLRRDTLDNHFGDWSWKKVVGLGSTLLRKIKEAKEESEVHRIAFEELNGALRLETTGLWTIAIEHWEDNLNDSSVTNPFKAKVIRTDVSMHADVSSSIFIASGIDLENEQCCLKVDIGKQGLHTTDTQMGTVQRQWNTLQCKIDTWKHIQTLYTPAVQLLESRAKQPSHSTSDMIKPEDSQLWLPSTLDWLHGQSANTRAQNAVSRVEARATAAAEKYHAAHMALSSLAHVLRKVGWDHKYQVLDRKNDIRGMSVPKRGESEGRRQLSWIWLVEGVRDDEDEVIQYSLRVEWCKACARSMRWAEEVGLLQEEMHRVSCFLRWHASWWSTKIVERMLGTAADNEGLGAYACRQAQFRDDLTDCFEKKWAAHHPLTVADTRCNNMRSVDSAPESMAASEAELDLYLPELPLP
ncbi:uncharacterized protein BJ212DRAFT_1576808 [Suillus subaureus]|uniref:CxC2-like cysteine cluster KDZ transposase-associated domain-containing protein n=1 Tax=Suillus subaureus TaxID=48587 RepID=A0A9P7ECV3_9AGAM|nr:uncharacterized protein BJ212DRAFT_1576808 [Suillus subaureus]KAG1817161.1 hypothetical protein BJ212DRAFT_1576808 [Suillus subaureus]